MPISKEKIQEFKNLLEKEMGEEVSWEYATESAHNLANLIDLLMRLERKERERKHKLATTNPKGFSLEGQGYTCFICNNSCSDEGMWYDKWGIKCRICQRAIDKRMIPASMAKYKDKWYSTYDIKDRFGITHHALKKFLAHGVLVSRDVLTPSGKIHCQLFLLKDNKGVLPPKHLTDSVGIQTKGENGKVWISSEPWYCFKERHEAVKDYGIMKYIEFVDKS